MVDNINERTNAITDYHKGINTPTQFQERIKQVMNRYFQDAVFPGLWFKGDNFALTVVLPTLLHQCGKQGARLVLFPIALRPVSLTIALIFSNLFVISSKFYMEPVRRFGRIHKYMRQIYCRSGVYRH